MIQLQSHARNVLCTESGFQTHISPQPTTKMTSAFSSAESAVLERTVDVENSSQSPATLADIWSAARLAECSDWIHSNGYRKVCLQFADELLPFSVRITLELKTECRRRQKLTVASSDDADGRSKIEIYILGDTSYGSCCVDEVAASHVDADAIIHFGHACLSRVVRLPLMHVFYHYRLDADAFVNAVRPLAYGDASVFVFYNVGYYYELGNIGNYSFDCVAMVTITSALCRNPQERHPCGRPLRKRTVRQAGARLRT